MWNAAQVRQRIAASPTVCQTCVHLDADFIHGVFEQICLKGHPMTEETCLDQKES